MITEQINNGLIEAMKDRVPAGMNLARVLMDLLYIGKEAVYRRLRGEVPFTLAEAATISGKLGISLDRLVGANSANNAIFDLNLIRKDDPMEAYHDMLDDFLKLVTAINGDSVSEISTAANMVPLVFTMKYDMLSKFRFAKWMYQNQKIGMSDKFQDIVIPDKFYRKQKEYVEQVENIGHVCFILDNMLFISLVNDVKYFMSINIIGPEELHTLKEEMLAMLDSMCALANTGKFRSGKDIQMYISNINFEATYSYMQARNFYISMLRVFSINSITSKDADVFRNLKDWINSLKKFSILITQSGEMHRIQFFNKQREIINSL